MLETRNRAPAAIAAIALACWRGAGAATAGCERY